MSISTTNIKRVVIANQSAGFDELALMCGCSKKRVKEVWNNLKLGFKHIPRTLPTIKPLPGFDYELQNDVIIYIDPFTPVVIPSGYTTDLGSVPRFLRWVVDKDDRRFLVGFLLHDIQYETQFVNRGVADAMLLMNAKRLGAPWHLYTTVYIAVRIGGWYGWRKSSKLQDRKESLYQLISKATEEYTGSIKQHNIEYII